MELPHPDDSTQAPLAQPRLMLWFGLARMSPFLFPNPPWSGSLLIHASMRSETETPDEMRKRRTMQESHRCRIGCRDELAAGTTPKKLRKPFSSRPRPATLSVSDRVVGSSYSTYQKYRTSYTTPVTRREHAAKVPLQPPY